MPRVWSSSTICELLGSLQSSTLSSQAYDQKNIRRRVYDALNVLMAMNIISKEKKEIKWIGLPTNSAQECQSLEVRPACGCPRPASSVPALPAPAPGLGLVYLAILGPGLARPELFHRAGAGAACAA